jgi:hypothetical protein
VNAWDPDLQRWLHRVSELPDVKWHPEQGTLDVDQSAQQRWLLHATHSVTTDLPGGWYLVRVEAAGAFPSRRLFTIAAGTAHRYAHGDLPPKAMDVAVSLSAEPVYALLHHDGGTLGVNLFAADAAARIARVDTFSVTGFADYRAERERERERALPDLAAWKPDAPGGVTVKADADTLIVNGNSSGSGYQLVSAPVAVQPDASVMIRVPVEVRAGQVCTGVLDESQQTWLAAPTDHEDEHRFRTGRSRNVFIVVANCNGAGATAPVASRFVVGRGGYAVNADRWYVDSLMRFW